MQPKYIEGQGFTLADGMYIPDVFVRTIVVIIVFYVITSFLLALIRMLLNHRLKNKMVNLEYSAVQIEAVLNCSNESRNYAVKWIMLLLSATVGLILMSQFRFGWLSLALLTFCLSIGYGLYFRYLKKSKTDQYRQSETE